MADLALDTHEDARSRAQERFEFRITLFATFWIFLIVALLGRLWPGRRSTLSGPRASVFREARETANAVIPFAFMSW